jgi:hypothetical protein
MTQAQFDLLPAVLSSGTVCSLCGFSRHELAAEVKAGKIKLWRPCYVRMGCQSARPKYTKASVARRLGFKL